MRAQTLRTIDGKALMSFILDALKKSETERQRTSGPALFEVRAAAPRTRLPLWALAVGALLAINLIVLLWVLLHRDKAASAVPDAAAAATARTAAPQPALPAAVRSTVPARGPSLPAARTSALSEPPLSVANPEDERPAVLPGSAAAAVAERERARARREAQQQAALVREQTAATVAAPAAARRAATATARGSGLPTRDELVNSGRARIPELTLSLHVWDADAKRRFVFINGARAREGDSLGNGIAIDSITPDGVILSSGGQKFVLMVQ